MRVVGVGVGVGVGAGMEMNRVIRLAFSRCAVSQTARESFRGT